MMPFYAQRAIAGRLASACLAATLGGCGSSSDPDHDVVTAVVFGTVTRTSGTAVEGARISAVSYLNGCSGQVIAGADWVFSDDRGSYRVRLRDPSVPRSMCVTVLVAPGAAGVADTVKVPGPTLEFRHTRAGEPEDSARVDVRLP